MDLVTEALHASAWSVQDRTLDACGWDYTASKSGKPHLLIEVKGLSGSLAVPELTPNEYKHLELHRDGKATGRYIGAIVTDALDPDKRRLVSYAQERRGWLPFSLSTVTVMPKPTHRLVLTDAVAARCSVDAIG